MKKILVIALAVIMMVSALALVACGQSLQTKTAYGLVHGKGYVGKATVFVDGDKVLDATLDEACLPTYVVATAASDDTVTATVLDHGKEVQKHFYKTVKFAGVEMVYDATNGYQVGSTKMLDFFADEANCEKWFEAVAQNEVSVMIAGKEDKTIMTAAKLLKSQNGYWSTNANIGTTAAGWAINADATCRYVVKNGIDAITAKADFTQASRYEEGTTGVYDNEWVDKNGVKTGATWTDMWDYLVILKAAIQK